MVRNDEMISSEDISVVVSGPIIKIKDKNSNYFCATKKGCESIREKLPNAEIILSTWEDEDISDLDYDILVISKDPGANVNNVNRQICSRRAGIRKASRRYVLAMRSESYINTLDFIDYFDKYNLHGLHGLNYLEKRVVIPAAVPAHRHNEWFHMGDWYYFGQKEDLLKIWDLPYMIDDYYCTTYKNNDNRIVYNAHRYLMTAFINKFYPLTFVEKTDYTKEKKEIYEAVLAENFVLTGFFEFGLLSYKYPDNGDFRNRLFHYKVEYTFGEWLELYNKYSGGREFIHKSILELLIINVCIPISNFFSYSCNLIKKIAKKARRFFSGAEIE